MKKLALVLAVLLGSATAASALETDDYGFPIWTSNVQSAPQQTQQQQYYYYYATPQTRQQQYYYATPQTQQQYYYAAPQTTTRLQQAVTNVRQIPSQTRSVIRNITPSRTRTINISNFFRNR